MLDGSIRELPTRLHTPTSDDNNDDDDDDDDAIIHVTDIFQ